MTKVCTLAIDIGATKTLFALVNDQLEVVDELKIKTDPGKGETSFVKRLEASVQTVVKNARENDWKICGVGAGIPGEVDIDGGEIGACPNIPFLPNCGLRQRLARLTRSAVVFANDCHLALLGVHQVGAATGYKNVIGVFLVSGIGGAVMIDGRLHLGASGVAGDLGHYLLQPIGPLAGSDRQGLLDDFVSRAALSSEAARLAAKQWASYLQREIGTDVRNIRSSHLAEAIKHGDECIEDLVRSRMRTVGIVLSNFVDFLNPELVVLGGGLVEAMPRLVRAEVKMGIKEHTTPRARKAVQVVVSKLKGHAVTIGAAKLSQQHGQRKKARPRNLRGK
jgi:glucokinase